MFHDLTEIRAKWHELPKEQQDSFLADMASSLAGEKLEILPARRPPNWPTTQKLIASQMGMSSVYQGGSVALVSIAVFGYLAFYSHLRWYWLIGVAVALFYLVQKVQLGLARSSIKNAALKCPALFAPLWELDAFAIQLAGTNDYYDNTSGHNRWQDVVLTAAGWKELTEEEIVSRREKTDKLSQTISDMVERNREPG